MPSAFMIPDFLLSMVPILFLLAVLGVFRLPAHVAALASLVLTVVLALAFFGMGAVDSLTAVLEGAALALWPISLVIIAAIYTYNLAVKSGSLETIKTMLVAMSPDRRVQVLILAWGFGGFLEAVAGYGTAVAIPASILAVLGFPPLFAAVLCLLANTVPTAFGAVGIPVSTLAQITGLEPGPLSLAVGLQLTPFIVLIPLVLVMMTGVPDTRPGAAPGSLRKGPAALRGVLGITLSSGLAFALPQLAAAAWLGAELPSLLGSLSSMIVTIVLARRSAARSALPVGQAAVSVTMAQGIKAWLPYLIMFVLIVLSSPLVPWVHHVLGSIKSVITIYSGAGASPQTFKWIATPGVLILIAAVTGAAIQGLRPGVMIRTLGSTVIKLGPSTLTVVCILAMAKIMDHSGMISALSAWLVTATGPVYPLVAGFMGTLGTFVTGSDTSSNILFGKLQVEVAARTGLDPYWLAAANTAGATAGKMISPQSIAVATSATGLQGQEGTILGKTVVFCLAYVVILGILVWSLAPLVRFAPY